MIAPTPPPPDRAALHRRVTRRAAVLDAVRRFFAARDFVEVDTAVAVRAPAPERYIEAPSVTIAGRHGPETRYLQTSPELPMKRLVAAGLERIYQIAAVFRDGDHGPLHRPEFRLLEWYRGHAPWTALVADCEDLLRACAAAVATPGAEPNALHVRGRQVDLAAPFLQFSCEQAFVTWVGCSLLAASSRDALAAALAGCGIAPADDDSYDDLFHRAFVARIEPALAALNQPVFLTHYPLPMAALAQPCAAVPGTAERLELFVAGVELANGFGELTCAHTQRARFVAEAEARRAAGRADYPLDEAFLAALDHLPPTAGIALGLDRLVAVLTDADDLDGVAALPWETT